MHPVKYVWLTKWDYNVQLHQSITINFIYSQEEYPVCLKYLYRLLTLSITYLRYFSPKSHSFCSPTTHHNLTEIPKDWSETLLPILPPPS